MSIYLPRDIHDAFERFMMERHPDLNQTQTIALILRQWLVQEGYLAADPQQGTLPDELNASNDD